MSTVKPSLRTSVRNPIAAGSKALALSQRCTPCHAVTGPEMLALCSAAWSARVGDGISNAQLRRQICRIHPNETRTPPSPTGARDFKRVSALQDRFAKQLSVALSTSAKMALFQTAVNSMRPASSVAPW